MSDLVERLRDHFEGVSDKAKSSTFDLVLEAADRIEQLEVALRAVIVRCEEGDKKSDWLPTISNIARAALDQSSPPKASRRRSKLA